MGERRPDGGRAHRRLPPRPRALLALLRRPLRRRWSTSSPTAPTRRSPSSSAAATSTRVDHAEHRRAAPQGGHARAVEVHGSIEPSSCLACAAAYPLDETRARLAGDPHSVPHCDCGAPAEARRRPVRRVAARRGAAARPRARERRRPAALRRLVAGGPPVAQLPRVTLAAGGRVAIVTQGPTPWDGRARGQARRRRRRGSARPAGPSRLAGPHRKTGGVVWCRHDPPIGATLRP